MQYFIANATSITARLIKKHFFIGIVIPIIQTAYLVAALHFVAVNSFSQVLQIVPSNNQAVLSWPLGGTNQFGILTNQYYVQVSTNIASTAAWINATNNVYSDGTNDYFTNSIIGTSQFFRLQAWTILFNGTSTAAFRGYQQANFPGANSWIIDTNGDLKTVAGGTFLNIITTNQYSNFEVDWLWKCSTNGNSGVNYRSTEEYSNSEWSGPEFQLLDDAHYSITSLETIGSVWDLIAPTNKVLVPTGQWNSCRLIVQGTNVQHWLNGNQVVGYSLNSSSFLTLVSNNSIFNKYPDFAKASTGYIAFRNDNTVTWFRNIIIRTLP